MNFSLKTFIIYWFEVVIAKNALNEEFVNVFYYTTPVSPTFATRELNSFYPGHTFMNCFQTKS